MQVCLSDALTPTAAPSYEVLIPAAPFRGVPLVANVTITPSVSPDGVLVRSAAVPCM